MINQKSKTFMWKEENNCLVREFRTKDFITAFGFMSEVALLAEKQDHHPTWTNTYNSVKIVLCTHDAGNQITDKDHRLAAGIDALWASRGSA